MMLSLDRLNSDRKSSRNILSKALQDIACNIKIDNHFAIHHPQYHSLELPAAIKNSFFKAPEAIKINYLQNKLQSFIFKNYYNEPQPLFLNQQSSIETESPLTTNSEEKDTIENHTFKWSKTKFYRDLRHFNRGRGHFESGWLVLGKNEEGLIKVCKNDLIVHIDPKRHLENTEQIINTGDLISIKMPPQYVEPGYYIAVSNLGSINDLDLESNDGIVDIYFNLNSEGALFFLDKITTQLNKWQLIFNFQTLYRPQDYLISDAANLSFLRQDYDLIIAFIKTIYQENTVYFKPETPLFAKYLAPGLSLAERPISPEGELRHFGVYCCQIIAIAIIKAWQANINSTEQKLKYITNAFSDAGIDLEKPYLNPNSEDIYQF